MPHDLATSPQHRAQDTLRWGGRTSLVWGPASPAGGNSNANMQNALNLANGNLGRQLVNAHWRWPLAWQTLVVMQPQFAADETGAVVVSIEWTIGSGDAQLTFSSSYTLAPTPVSGVYASIIDPTIFIPACDIMVQVKSLVAAPGDGKGPNTATVDSLDIGVFVAPQTEPHATLHLLEHWDKYLDSGNREDGWMPPGFNPEPLGYTR